MLCLCMYFLGVWGHQFYNSRGFSLQITITLPPILSLDPNPTIAVVATHILCTIEISFFATGAIKLAMPTFSPAAANHKFA